MAVIQKKKLCWNCEGNVSVSEETCPYCGVSVIPASLEGTSNSYIPPYQMGTAQSVSVPPPPYGLEEKNEYDSENKEESPKESDDQDVSVDEFKHVVLSLMLLLAGSMFFLFGLTLALFSHNGIFTLQWNGGFWYVYSLLSIPLLLFGWRALLKLDAEK
jgi:ribosomal protein S27AE